MPSEHISKTSISKRSCMSICSPLVIKKRGRRTLLEKQKIISRPEMAEKIILFWKVGEKAKEKKKVPKKVVFLGI